MNQKAARGMVGEVVLATSRLVGALEAEVDALRKGKVSQLEDGRIEKARLIRNYEAKLQALKSQPMLRASVEPALRDELESATGRLQKAIDRNVAQLRAAAEANRRLVDALAKAATEAAAFPSYGPRIGAMAAAGGRLAAGGAPAAVSRQL